MTGGRAVDYAWAADYLESYRRARETWDGDLIVSLFGNDAEYHDDPFEPPLVGHNALRAHWLAGAQSEDQVEVTIERHWTSGETILAAWHGGYVRRSDAARVRETGFMTFEVRDGVCARFRQWSERREAPTAA